MGRKHGATAFSLLDNGGDPAGRRRCVTSGALGILGMLLIAAAFHPVLQSTVLQWVRISTSRTVRFRRIASPRVCGVVLLPLQVTSFFAQLSIPTLSAGAESVHRTVPGLPGTSVENWW